MTRFFARIFRWIRSILIAIGILTLIGLFSMMRFFQSSRPNIEQMTLKDKMFLRLELKGEIVEKIRGQNFLKSFLKGEDDIVYLPELREALANAAKDDRVKALIVNAQSVHGSLADFSELRDDFLRFKESQKPIYFWSTGLDTKTFELASVADRIAVSPLADINLSGPVFHLLHFKDAMDSLGLQFDVIRAGKFKSAFESFVENAPSQETLQMYQELGDSIRRNLITNITSGRKVDADTEVTEWFRQSLFTPDNAKTLKIIDEVIYFPEFEKNLLADQDSTTVDLWDYVEISNPQQVATLLSVNFGSKQPKKEPALALMEWVGEIHSEGFEDKILSPEKLVKEIEWAKTSEEIKAVVLRISSPGGSANAADLIWSQLKQLADVKPVVVSIGGVAASGGYYIASCAKKIFAEPTSITGSIGVISLIPNFHKIPGKYGVHFQTLTESQRSAFYGLDKKLTDEDRKALQKSVDYVYGEFVRKVAEGRSMTVEQVHEIAQGRVWTGEQGIKIGLVDELGGLVSAIQAAKGLAQLDESKDYPLLRWRPKIKSFRDCLKGAQYFEQCINSTSSEGVSLQSNPTLAAISNFFIPSAVLDVLQGVNHATPTALWTDHWMMNTVL